MLISDGGAPKVRGAVLQPITEARALVAAADRCFVLTGAGISAESGVPTFRSDGGLWKSYRAEDLATPGAFARDSRLVWEWYGWRRELVQRCAPNAAHFALARWAADRAGVTIATQNVDGLHAAAGGPPPIELHGSLFRMRCTCCEWREDGRGPIDATSAETLPRCARCRALARPDVVWFGESLDRATIERAFEAASAADVCLVVGTSAVVQPAASLANATHEAGGAVIEVNPVETPLTAIAAISLRGTAVGVVPVILGSRV